jgi:hypothetical protein
MLGLEQFLAVFLLLLAVVGTGFGAFLREHVLEAWSPVWQCWEVVEPLRDGTYCKAIRSFGLLSLERISVALIESHLVPERQVFIEEQHRPFPYLWLPVSPCDLSQTYSPYDAICPM